MHNAIEHVPAESLLTCTISTMRAKDASAKPQGSYKAAVWKRDLVSMLPKCTPNSSRLDSSKLLNTVPLDTPVCFLFSACMTQSKLNLDHASCHMQ